MKRKAARIISSILTLVITLSMLMPARAAAYEPSDTESEDSSPGVWDDGISEGDLPAKPEESEKFTISEESAEGDPVGEEPEAIVDGSPAADGEASKEREFPTEDTGEGDVYLLSNIVGKYNVDFDGPAYNDQNPYSAKYKGECTWYCWGRAMEKCGIYLPSLQDGWGSAGSWYEGAQKSIANGRTDIAVGRVPMANSIGVKAGHVFFVEDVQDSIVSYSEGNYTPSALPGKYNEGTLAADDASVIGYIYLNPDFEPPTLTSSAKVSAVSGSGFTVSAGAEDNMGITSVWADVWMYGQTAGQARRVEGYMQSGRAVVTVNTDDFGGFRGEYYLNLHVSDAAGNQGHLEDIEKISLYPVNALRTGSYLLLAGGTVRSAPSDGPVNGRDTYASDIGFLGKVSVAGEYADPQGQNWLNMADGNWVKSDWALWMLRFSDLYNILKTFIERGPIYFIAGQPVTPSGGLQLFAASGNGSYAVLHGVSYSTQAASGAGGSTTPAVTFDTVNFNPNGGQCGTTSARYIHGNAYGSLPTPYRFGYTFDGWFTDPEAGVLVSAGDVCLSGQTLYAHWTRIVLLQGACGDELNFILWGDGVLELTGVWEATGEMSSHPWTNQYAERIYEVILPDGLTNICAGAFSGCKYLQIIQIPDTVTSIGGDAFYQCEGLKQIDLPDSIIRIDYRAFAQSGLTSLVLPRYLQTLGYGVLSGNTGVTSVFIPKTITAMPTDYSNGTFTNSALETVVIEDGAKNVYGCAFSNCRQLKNVTIPESVTEIGSGAFEGCIALTGVTLPQGLASIGSYAFRNCSSLTGITLPDGLASLGSGFLSGASGVTYLTIPKTVNEMGSALSGSSIRTVSISYGATSVPNAAYSGCKALEQITLPDTVTSIGGDAFYQCEGLKHVDLPDSIIRIDYRAFAQSGLTSLVLPRYLQTLGYGVLSGNTGVTSVFIPKTITAMPANYGGEGAFTNSALESAVIEDGAKNVYGRAFSNCRQLKNVTIPESVTEIGSGAFEGCIALTGVMLPQGLASIGSYTFRNCSSLTGITLPDKLTSIGSGALYASGLTSITIPESVTTMGTEVFKNCTSLETAVWNNVLTTIPGSTFEECGKLRGFTVTSSVRNIGAKAFYHCSSLENPVWEGIVTEIGDSAFAGCTAMTALDIPNGLTKIGGSAFDNCDGLTSAVLPDSVTEIGTYIFSDCDQLTSVRLGTGLKAIPSYAFYHCDSLGSVTIPYRVTSIGAYAFANCVALTGVMVPRNVAKIEKTSFNYQDRLTIYGVAGTYAQTFADANFFTFRDQPVHATAVTLSRSELRMNKGAYFTLTMAVDPANFTDKVTWKSSDTNVATVNDDGRIYAQGLGGAIISLVVGDASAACRVTVVQPVTSISLNRNTLTLDPFGTFQLTASPYPSTANNRSYEWQSSDEAIASVDANGLVTGWGKGTATIRAVALDGSGISGGCTVTVTGTAHAAAAPEELQSPHNYPDNCSDIWSYTVPDAEYLDVTFDPRTEIEEGFDYLTITDGAGKAVDGYSRCTGKSLAGQTVRVMGDTIRLKLVSDDSGGKWGFGFSKIEPHIFQPVAAEGLSFEPNSLILALNASTTLIPRFQPENTTNQEVSWESSNKEIATVSRDGVVRTLKAGTAVITATAADGGFTASVTIRVETSASCGDVNNDGAVDAIDALLVMRSIVGLTQLDSKQRTLADVNGDGQVNTGDAVLILRYDAGLITRFPSEQ